MTPCMTPCLTPCNISTVSGHGYAQVVRLALISEQHFLTDVHLPPQFHTSYNHTTAQAHAHSEWSTAMCSSRCNLANRLCPYCLKCRHLLDGNLATAAFQCKHVQCKHIDSKHTARQNSMHVLPRSAQGDPAIWVSWTAAMRQAWGWGRIPRRD